MKKFLSIFVTFIALCACNSEDVVSDGLSTPEEEQTQISRSAESDNEIKYPFINLMVGEDMIKAEPRTAFLKRDADYLKNRNASEQVMDMERLQSMYDEANLDGFEDELDQKILDLYGAENLMDIKKALRSYVKGREIDYDNISLSPVQLNHFNLTVRFLGDIARPYKDYLLMSNFGSATTEEDCFEAAMNELVELGIGYGLCLVTGTFVGPSTIFTAYQAYKIYREYEDCLERVRENEKPA